MKVFDVYVKSMWQKARKVNQKFLAPALAGLFVVALPIFLEMTSYAQQFLTDALV